MSTVGNEVWRVWSDTHLSSYLFIDYVVEPFPAAAPATPFGRRAFLFCPLPPFPPASS